jgi:hypothetical protein
MSAIEASAGLDQLTAAFSRARDPWLDDLLGTHRGSFAGPWWLRLAASWTVRLTGMGPWCGKTLHRSGDDAVLEGANLIRRGQRVIASIPVSAHLGLARLDHGPAIIVDYPPTAPWPWRHVTDELRPLDNTTLLGLTYGIPATPPTGAPFLLHRTASETRKDE